MKPTKNNIEDFRAMTAEEILKYLEEKLGPFDEKKAQYSDAEWRVLCYSNLFGDIPEMVEHAQITMEMLKDRWEDLVALDEYMASGDWQKDYEADERGEIRKELPRGVLAQDQLYDALRGMDEVMKDMRRLCRHYKTANRSR